MRRKIFKKIGEFINGIFGTVSLFSQLITVSAQIERQGCIKIYNILAVHIGNLGPNTRRKLQSIWTIYHQN